MSLNSDGLHSSHEALVESGKAGDGPIDPVIRESWDRCQRRLGVSFSEKAGDFEVSNTSCKERLERLGAIIPFAQACMTSLATQISGSGYTVLLTDAQGIILNTLADPIYKKELEGAGVRPGISWQEQHQGTNAIGTAISTKMPTTVFKHEHYREDNTILTCSAAPIFDPTGDLLAILDASSPAKGTTKEHQAHTLALVYNSARTVENFNFIESMHGHNWLLRFHRRREYVGYIDDAILAINESGRIVGTNSCARELFSGDFENGSMLGIAIDTIFEISISDIISRADQGASLVWPINDILHNRAYFATTSAPNSHQYKPLGSSVAHPRKTSPQAASPVKPGELNLDQLAGEDPTTNRIIEKVRKIVDKPISIILSGETGAGKDAMALAIHRTSSRRNQPFVAVNCASIPESLIESELFGYSHGAFTGARKGGHKGKIEASSGGTLFLNEIGDMAPELQTRLLQVLETNEVSPLGSNKIIPVNLCVLCATHRNLPELITRGIFRQDLYYRLSGIVLRLPALRDRSDLKELIQFSLKCESGEEAVSIDENTMHFLLNYEWPGNIRQLRNVLRTACAIAEDGKISMEDFPDDLLQATQQQSPYGKATTPQAEQHTVDDPGATAERAPTTAHYHPMGKVAEAEKCALEEALATCSGNITNAAKLLGISRSTLYRKMNKAGLSEDPPRNT
ncbi:MAG: sigma-54-dependent Fis family transcriptional regulator [Proteobacteria bacterium]|nr:sigma-54-dependent Fis family transcriptional regulator [Pseudomonadota bacterium]